MKKSGLHRLLKRQLKKTQCNLESIPNAEQYQHFLELISKSYIDMDADRYTLERSMEVLSEEMQELYQKLKHQYESRQSDILDALPDVLFLLDEDGRYLEILTGKVNQLYKAKDELKGKLISDVVPEKSAALFLNAINETLDTNQLTTIEYSLQAPKGRCFFEGRITPAQSMHNNKRAVIFLAIDITKRKLAVRKDRLVSKIMRAAAEGMVIMDGDKKIISVNPAYCRITSRDETSLIGTLPAFNAQIKNKSQLIWNYLDESDHWVGEIEGEHYDGTIFPIWLTIEKIYNKDEDTINYVAILTDVSEIKQSREQLEHVATHDSLTQLPNRVLFHDRLSQAMARAGREAESVALFFLDLDRFKVINDNLGHHAGDDLLKQVTRRLQKSCREDDSLARLGGDEFTIITEHINTRRDAEVVAEKIMNAFQEAFSIDDILFDISASIGISLYPDDADNMEDLIKNADTAMYQAKKIGFSSYQFYTRAHSQTAYEFFTIEQGLRKALEQDEFFMVYQPQFNMTSNQMIGVEALIRWSKPEVGLISPAKFIPIAENSGLIISIGDWVIDSVLSQMKTWDSTGLPEFTVSINLSRRQLTTKNLCEKLQKSLAKYQLAGSRIELEITESSIIENEDIAYENIIKLHEMGISLSIDDFGTGHSSLVNLKRYPLNRLKIDRGFVRDVTVDKNDEAIIIATIALARSFNLKVIAEGVETTEQRDFLLAHNCDEVQGYLYSKPILPSEIQNIFQTTENDSVSNQ